jgi:hypothetical protein
MLIDTPHDVPLDLLAPALASIGLVIDGRRDARGIHPVRWLAEVPPYVRAVRRDTSTTAPRDEVL